MARWKTRHWAAPARLRYNATMITLRPWAGLAGLLLLVLTAGPARADEAAAWAALRSGEAIALVRHGLAPGVGDPPGWRLDDCSTQRNLDDTGRAESRALGERLRAERIRVTRLLSSPWCRCVETARLLGLAPPVQIDEAFANAYMLDDRPQSDQFPSRSCGKREMGTA
jgi:hypothetical protein